MISMIVCIWLENDLEEADASDEDIEIVIQLQRLILYIYCKLRIHRLSTSTTTHIPSGAEAAYSHCREAHGHAVTR